MSLTNGSIGLQISWQPPTRPHGELVGYLLHYTTNWTLPLAKWSRRRSPAYSVNTVLVGLSRGSIYFIQLRARNRHGNGPLSPIRLYRTPDASGQGGGEIPLGRAYYDALSIPKELISLDFPPSSTRSKLDPSIASQDAKLTDTMDTNSNTWDRDSDSLQFVTVSQQLHEDAILGQPTDCVAEELQRNQTPTRTASVSSNSCAGSFGTPTRFVVNPTYQTHAPTTRFPVS
ncbi:hypothetical protein P879_11711 [Paragonimus westermani]|uniref:Fibronectin type-III domain-containing protein n=1 Tax=Paragonimus westermani TaxID=34504 RepID=A0A8T0D7J8_9TREM|nr:hypothetical protein P879_11711 [Paragonimus westermani]